MAINRIKTGGITDGTIQSGDLAPGTIASDRIAPGTIANDRLANNSITINGNAVSLGGSITAGTDWQAVTVADGSTTLNAVAGKGYFLDTNTGVIEVFLPSSPTRGDTVILADYSGTFGTNKVIVNTGGELIDSTIGGPNPGNEFEITTNNAIVELVYVDAAKGWLVKDNTAPSALSTLTGQGGGYDSIAYTSATGGTVTTSGDYKIHVFTGDGCFVVSQAGTGGCAPAVVDYLVVAGGGGGGADYAGGGGAGGFRVSNSYGLPAPTMSPLANPTGLTVTATTYPVTVGAGGAGNTPPVSPNTNGSNSVFSTITSTGGGKGGQAGAPKDGAPGGSGGGARSDNPAGGIGGSGNTPPTSPSQGNDGGLAGNPNSGYGGGGGGGAGAVGVDGDPFIPTSGTGGSGSYVSPSFAVGCAGTTGPVCGVRYFSGGGGGAANAGRPGVATPVLGAGGIGGGGRSGIPCNGPWTGPDANREATAGTANTGGGGGAGAAGGITAPGKAGGKGIVIIRYKFQ